MIIAMIGQEKNLGILTVTDFLIGTLGKENVAVFGWSYLVKDYTKLLDQIDKEKNNKSILIKYVIPKTKFNTSGSTYPKELESICDVIFRVPTYFEEVSSNTQIIFFKGQDNPISAKIIGFYQ